MGQYADQIEATANQQVPTAPTDDVGQLLTGPGLLTIVADIVAAVRALEGISAGADFRLETRAPLAADGDDGDGWLNGATGDLFRKENGAWVARGNLKGPKGNNSTVPGPKGDNSTVPGPKGDSNYQLWLAAGNTGNVSAFLASQKGADGGDGQDGADGTIVFLETYVPDDALGVDGNQWTYVNTTYKTASFYKKSAGKWRLVGAPTGGGIVTPPAATNQPPNISISAPTAGTTVTAGTQLNIVALATDDVSVASVVFLNAAGGTLAVGAKNGSQYTATITVPNTVGALVITAKATDGQGLSSTAEVTVTVQAASILATYQATAADYQSKCSVAAPSGYAYPTGNGSGGTQQAANDAARVDAISKITCPVGPVIYSTNLSPGESGSGVTYNGLPGSILRFNTFTPGDALPGASIGFFVGGQPVGGADLGTTAAQGVACALSYNGVTYTTGNGAQLILQNVETVNLT